MNQTTVEKLADASFLARAVFLGQGDAFAREHFAERTHPLTLSVATGGGVPLRFEVRRDARQRAGQQGH
ncbi:MAG: hypothetical protein A2360_04720 [Candidatus Staskawiczbacteria bacterium RIFOXYB1_FULL_32_11]|uniref:Uncharacterized protein n=1 Tax=Candidatus Staskawiczbacteria bacterium RIFOXYD1_FULL_32_13 TaxID=1802234 RepID=A0A1G2JKG2_9BACT|nr:MAG: hypothetical protein A2360_04720 [Candidatus Staskawiczbacteria bacterium RIFOXYB1_FULL_32_11]OGZ80864.1 MAG: hypothetical protein A2256_00070 [Candidatus Staskawiczbacteria bacterium RIFOXYA2_FULL_32_7]OGZ87443.1 MAG: hypothetical protein A2561_04225 [Candidatus Staskawiczbacteria bacterium RIFOXYD1_FULL_32_13]